MPSSRPAPAPAPAPASVKTPLADHQKGLLLTTLGVLMLTPDSLLVRLIDAEPFGLLVWRGLLQALGIVAILALLHRSGPHPSVGAAFRAVGRPGLLLAAVFSGSTLFFILALSLTTVADVLVIIAAAPLTAAVFGWIFLGEGVPLRTWVAIALTLAGIAFLVSEDLGRSEEHTSELQSLMRISYAVFCLKTKT